MASNYHTTLSPKVKRNFVINLLVLFGLVAAELYQPLSGGIFKWLYYLIILWVGSVALITGLLVLRHQNNMIAVEDNHLVIGTGLSTIRRHLSEVKSLTFQNGRWVVELDNAGVVVIVGVVDLESRLEEAGVLVRFVWL